MLAVIEICCGNICKQVRAYAEVLFAMKFGLPMSLVNKIGVRSLASVIALEAILAA